MCYLREKGQGYSVQKLLNNKNVKVVEAKLHTIFLKNSVINPQGITVPYCGQAVQ